jgi:SAM-dependent methyltransferase
VNSGILASLLHILRDRRKKTVFADQTRRVSVDFEIARDKPEFTRVVRDIQEFMLSRMLANLRYLNQSRRFIELGAGVIPMSSWRPDIVSTDIVDSAHLDGVLDATRLDLIDESVDGLFLQNTFHHIPDPAAFFSEAMRVLIPGGRIVIIDPYYNLISAALYKRLFETEVFDMGGDWDDASSHAMIGANQALSYIVFVRDRERFNSENPGFSITETHPLRNGLRYLLTGGLNFRRIAPRWLFPILTKFESHLAIFNLFSIHWVVVLEKIDTRTDEQEI